MDYRLVAIDVDETLLNSRHEITPRVRGTIKKAMDKGVVITIATGRSFESSLPFIRDLGVNGPVINFGGAQITDSDTGEVIALIPVPHELAMEAIDFARSFDLHIQTYDGDVFCVDEYDEWSEFYAGFGNRGRAVGDIRKGGWPTGKLLCIDTKERIAELLPLFRERFAGRLAVSMSKPYYIELNDPGANKGVALKRLSEILNIPREQIIAIGDNSIDTEMIKYAGLGICMANGTDEVKAAADFIAPSNDEDGVAVALERFILSGE